MPASTHKITFAAYWIMWADLQGWAVPAFHIRICDWLERCGARVRVLMVFRGAAKSTIFAAYKAWLLTENPRLRNMIWSADDKVATKLTRDTLNILRRHPWSQRKGLITGGPGAQSFWVTGATDYRNPSMHALGVNSNAVGSRCDLADFDDVEVPKNIRNPEARQAIRDKMAESTHILVPSGRKTLIGTPHTTDSIYTEEIAGGAESLVIPLYAHVTRYEQDIATRKSFDIGFKPLADGITVFAGIGKPAKVLTEGLDYHLVRDQVVFFRAPGRVIDICSGNAWPDYFTRDAVEFKRRETKTLNAWDSQYFLRAAPLHEIRLDPKQLRLYSVEPVLRTANDVTSMWLGKVQIVGAACRWDPAGGKVNSDVSAVAVVLQDATGARYWHRAVQLVGQVAVYSKDGRDIIGGQVFDLVQLVKDLHLPRVTVETNGIGGFAPSALTAMIRQVGIICGVAEEIAVVNKNRRILEAIEPPLKSGMLWAHLSVWEGPAREEMQSWVPSSTKQADDYIDALSGAITEQPERLFRQGHGLIRPADGRSDWRPVGGSYDIEADYS